MPFYTHVEVAEELAQYGAEYRNIDEACATCSHDQRSWYALLAILKTLKSVAVNTHILVGHVAAFSHDHGEISDGMMAAMRRLRTGTHLPVQPYHDMYIGLTRRANGVIARAISTGLFVNLEDITEDSLSGLRNCGVKTVAEILEWKAKTLDQQHISRAHVEPVISKETE